MVRLTGGTTKIEDKPSSHCNLVDPKQAILNIHIRMLLL